MFAQTIFALASGAGRAGIAVWRLSGPSSGPALTALAGRDLPPARRACRVRLANAAGETIDDGLALWFPAPASFTGEDVVELHLHGSRAVAVLLADALTALGLRPAEPGEFSRRAFEAGKLDLTQAEAIADLVAAETKAQLRQARAQMGGALSGLYEGWRQRLIALAAHLEAEIDFSDQDLPDQIAEEARQGLRLLGGEIARHLDDGGRGERLRDGFSVAILGAPNAGKSSLLNRIAGREAAIVSERAGTTRDVIETHLDLGGYPVILADTAGLRDSEETIEAEGVRRARARAEIADLRLVVFDAGTLPDLDRESLKWLEQGGLALFNKADLVPDLALPALSVPAFAVSARTGQGIGDLLAKLTGLVQDRLAGSAGPALTRARHRRALEDAQQSLRRAANAPLPELVAEDVRHAIHALGRITGRVDVEDLLDVIFRDFCIGK